MQSNARDLAGAIHLALPGQEPVRTTLATNARVIARVTDGIYRQPGSAIRELVSNAYDADASRVIVRTDAPRFGKISVEDDGNGMSPEVLAHLLRNIGGSAKRTSSGTELGVAGPDPTMSPGGRRLIGKLGIGLFSVSQLTRAFQIITKVQGDEFRTVATVKLRQFSDLAQDGFDESGDTDGSEYEAGEVLIWREKSDSPRQHGTTIVLTAVRSQSRESLQSRDIWSAVDNAADDDATGDPESFIPMFHIGRLDVGGEFVERAVDSTAQSLPWDRGDAPNDAFDRMVNAVWKVSTDSDPNPSLELLFDNYLKMIWDLALALPLAYVEGHLFDQPAEGWAKFFRISNKGRPSSAEHLSARAGEVRELLDLRDGLQATNFSVQVDDLELKRPIRFRDLPATGHALKHPLVFLGKFDESFGSASVDVSAGPLRFEAYFFWNAKIAPVDHRGALVRIFGASGAPFDHSFFRYQVSEQNRLRQITCEIFVSEGLEPALNIDREAFNTSHPHMVVLTKWVHNALRQIATTQKREANELRAAERARSEHERADRLMTIVDDANKRFTDGEGVIPSLELGASSVARSEEDTGPRIRVSHVDPFGQTTAGRTLTRKLESIVQVLSVSGALDNFTPAQVSNLVEAIREILATDG